MVDAPVEDEVPEELPVEVVLVILVAVVAVVACLTLPVVTVVFATTDEVSTDDGGVTRGKLVLMTEATGG